MVILAIYIQYIQHGKGETIFTDNFLLNNFLY